MAQKYIRITVTREQTTDLYVAVPDSFDHTNPDHVRAIDLERAVRDTVDESDWGWDDPEYERVGIEEVDAGEAEQYSCYEHAVES